MGRAALTMENQSDSSISAKKGDLDFQLLNFWPNVVVVGASHAGIAFADKLRKTTLRGHCNFDCQVGGLWKGRHYQKDFYWEVEGRSSRNSLRQKWYKNNKVRLKTQSIVTPSTQHKKPLR